MKQGELRIIPTPIGNLEDITLRGLRLLRESSIIACEDTRVTGRLLKLLEIGAKHLLSLHAHNERKRIAELLDRMQAGEHVALVSDAGTPGLSDPGSALIAGAINAGIRVEVLPGATAAIPALIGSGLKTRPALFEGFLPQKKGRQTRLRELSLIEATLILYESPHRLLKLLRELQEHFREETPVVVAREISKIHEEYVRGTSRTLLEEFESRPSVKGEIVVLIQGSGVGRSQDGERKEGR